MYRTVENLDINATINAKPLTGLGFGQKFYRPFPLPDISFFLFYEYIPHNSILWIWIKTGVGGFVAMLFLFGPHHPRRRANRARAAARADLVLAVPVSQLRVDVRRLRLRRRGLGRAQHDLLASRWRSAPTTGGCRRYGRWVTPARPVARR